MASWVMVLMMGKVALVWGGGGPVGVNAQENNYKSYPSKQSPHWRILLTRNDS